MEMSGQLHAPAALPPKKKPQCMRRNNFILFYFISTFVFPFSHHFDSLSILLTGFLRWNKVFKKEWEEVRPKNQY
jgi:hypothetical protein